jgi:hypothetical protein
MRMEILQKRTSKDAKCLPCGYRKWALIPPDQRRRVVEVSEEPSRLLRGGGPRGALVLNTVGRSIGCGPTMAVSELRHTLSISGNADLG